MYRHELRSNLKSLLIWSSIVLLLVIGSLAKFEGYHNNPEVAKLVESMPKALLEIFNMQAFNLTTLEGFYGVMAIFFYLMGGIASAMWAANAIAREEFNKTAEFTLVLPLSRSAILTAKALAALSTSMAFVLLTGGISLMGANRYQPTPDFYHFLALEIAGMFFISLIAWSLGLAFACWWKRPKQAASAAVGVLLAGYILATVQGLDERLAFIKWVTPFKYFDSAELYRNGALGISSVALTLTVVLMLVASAYLQYNRRDLAV